MSGRSVLIFTSLMSTSHFRSTVRISTSFIFAISSPVNFLFGVSFFISSSSLCLGFHLTHRGNSFCKVGTKIFLNFLFPLSATPLENGLCGVSARCNLSAPPFPLPFRSTLYPVTIPILRNRVAKSPEERLKSRGNFISYLGEQVSPTVTHNSNLAIFLMPTEAT